MLFNIELMKDSMSDTSWVSRGWRKVVEFFSTPETSAPWFSDEECRRLHDSESAHARGTLDEQTWQDLLLAPYFKAIAGDASIFGKQVLYQRLRSGATPVQRHASVQQLQSLMNDSSRADTLHGVFAPLRKVDTEIVEVLFQDAALPAVPRWLALLALVPMLFLIAGLTLAFLPNTGAAAVALLGAVGLLVMLVSLHMHYGETIDRWNAQMRALTALVVTAAQLGAHDHPSLQWFREHRADAARFNRRLNRFPLPFRLLEDVRSYFDWFTLKKVRHYFKQIRLIDQRRANLRELYLECGNLEANLSVARHLGQRPQVCWVQASLNQGIDIEHAVHPLLPTAQPLSLDSGRLGVFLTGQNGVGKSTLLRTIGINAVTARTFGFCYAARAAMPELSIHASMQGEDSLLDGESLYIAELRRARELLHQPGDGTRLYLIDEIFRGTNYLESVSAAGAFLHRLSERGIVIVSSHNTVLAPILAHKYAPRYLAIDEKTLQPVLLHGVVPKTNGIRLLKEHGFDDALEADACKVFGWLSNYLAQPIGGACVLGESQLKVVRRNAV